MRKVVVYSKEGCHLCERVIADLRILNVGNSFEISIQDITADPKLFERFWDIIPVVTVDGDTILTAKSLTDPEEVASLMRRALSA